MSDIKKWMNIITEQLQPTVINPPAHDSSFRKHGTVHISPELGGGIGSMLDNGEGDTSSVDVKGIKVELPTSGLSLPRADGTNPLEDPINDIMSINVLKDMEGLLRDNPGPKTGDLVRVDNVYGTAIGPGFGVFMAYSTNGQDAIISFDEDIITVPVEQISSVVEQEASDEFEKTGNDGALSPMSLTSNNRVTIGDAQMSNRDDFSKWMDAVEEGLGETSMTLELPAGELEMNSECGCGDWDCPVCFPEDGLSVTDAEAGPGACPACGHAIHADDCGPSDTFDYEDEFDFGDGEDMIVLADTYSDEDIEAEVNARGPEDSIDPVDAHRGQLQGPPDTLGAPTVADPDEDVSELIGKIQYMQDMGLSASDRHYDVDQLINIKDPSVIKRICDKVTGNIHENKKVDGDDDMSKKVYESDTAEDNEVLQLSKQHTSGKITTDQLIQQIEKLIDSRKGRLSGGGPGTGFPGEVHEDEFEDECADETEVATDMLNSIEKKIAIAKAALDQKASGIEEDDVDTPLADHGLRSLGNKIVNAKLKHAGIDAVVPPVAEIPVETSAPDEEVMEWVSRFAARDQKIAENSKKPVKEKAIIKPAPVTGNYQGADKETLDWVKRFNKLDNR